MACNLLCRSTANKMRKYRLWRYCRLTLSRLPPAQPASFIGNTQQTLATLSHSAQTGNLNWMERWGTYMIRHIDLAQCVRGQAGRRCDRAGAGRGRSTGSMTGKEGMNRWSLNKQIQQ